MQLRKPTQNQGSDHHSPGSYTGKVHEPAAWFKEWLENKSDWVLLECTHKADLKDKGQTVWVGTKKDDVLTICVKCWQLRKVIRHITYNEYREIPTAVIPDEPLF
jgi:hypothetical protein